jgi:hypothetical protein
MIELLTYTRYPPLQMADCQIDIVNWNGELPSPSPSPSSAPGPPLPPLPPPVHLNQRNLQDLRDKAFNRCCSDKQNNLANTYGLCVGCGFFFFVFSVVYFFFLKQQDGGIFLMWIVMTGSSFGVACIILSLRCLCWTAIYKCSIGI